MSSHIFNIYKKQGQTPLSCIKELKKAHPELSSLPITYAGRLDPLAEGVLLLLTGDECYKKEEYLSLSKEYEVEVLFGFSTDTYDLMGKIISSPYQSLGLQSLTEYRQAEMRESEELDYEKWHEDLILKIDKILPKFIGKIQQPYPPYSSRTVNGKPLFKWAREGRLNEIEIPTHDVFVDRIDIIEKKCFTGKDLLEEAKRVINKVEGDFRQKEILALWESTLKDKDTVKYHSVTFKISCGSGFYARVFAYDLGQKIGCPSLALKIIRTKVGEYTI